MGLAHYGIEPGRLSVRPVCLEQGRLKLLDQRRLPQVMEYFDATELDDLVFAIKDMVVRGAPAIGVTAALGLALEACRLAERIDNLFGFEAHLLKAKGKLQSSRPTAVNLRWATEYVFSLIGKNREKSVKEIAQILMSAAEDLIEDDIAINRAIGASGAPLLQDCASVLTHCNAGALATCGWGTALGVIRSAIEDGVKLTVYVDETRPRQQGARLTVWELMRDGIQPVLIADSMAGYLMAQGKIDAVIVGADRIASNGDVANKIGTYSLAVLAQAHDIPLYVAAPLSTLDPQISSGAEIPIEERDSEEVLIISGQNISVPGVSVLNPAFDVTPARLVTAIITEAGILRPPFAESIATVLSGDKCRV